MSCMSTLTWPDQADISGCGEKTLWSTRWKPGERKVWHLDLALACSSEGCWIEGDVLQAWCENGTLSGAVDAAVSDEAEVLMLKQSVVLQQIGIHSQTASLLELDDNPHLTTSTQHVMVGITRSKVMLFSSLLGEYSHLTNIFSNGLKPPTSFGHLYVKFSGCTYMGKRLDLSAPLHWVFLVGSSPEIWMDTSSCSLQVKDPKKTTHTVDGSEIRQTHQLIWQIFHYLHGFIHPSGGCLGFLPSTRSILKCAWSYKALKA